MDMCPNCVIWSSWADAPHDVIISLNEWAEERIAERQPPATAPSEAAPAATTGEPTETAAAEPEPETEPQPEGNIDIQIRAAQRLVDLKE
eukprot:SAG11_NODE_26984_length_338_cov_1.175732_1_plen_89_part_10